MKKSLPLYQWNGMTVGDHVVERRRPFRQGIVVRIIPGSSNEDHGTIYVWQMHDIDYGADNCEHYSAVNWQDDLKIIGSKVDRTK